MTTPLEEELLAARAAATRVVDDLRAELRAVGESTEGRPDDEHDAEGSTVGYERARVAALLHAAEASLARVDGALERRREGRDGVCLGCGREIPRERLRALPGATHCAVCARPAPPRSLSRRRP